MKGIAIVRSLLRRPPARSVLRSEAAGNLVVVGRYKYK